MNTIREIRVIEIPGAMYLHKQILRDCKLLTSRKVFDTEVVNNVQLQCLDEKGINYQIISSEIQVNLKGFIHEARPFIYQTSFSHKNIDFEVYKVSRLKKYAVTYEKCILTYFEEKRIPDISIEKVIESFVKAFDTAKMDITHVQNFVKKFD